MREGLGEAVLFGDSQSETVEEAVKEPRVLQPRSDKKENWLTQKHHMHFKVKEHFYKTLLEAL